MAESCHVPARWGSGVGRQLLEQLETLASRSGVSALRLETGVRQTEALTLYRSAGFVDILPFGSYGPDPLSVFMKKPFRGESAAAS